MPPLNEYKRPLAPVSTGKRFALCRKKVSPLFVNHLKINSFTFQSEASESAKSVLFERLSGPKTVDPSIISAITEAQILQNLFSRLTVRPPLII